jgi:hypothetical protein
VLERQHGGWRFEFESLAISQPLTMAARKTRHEYMTDQHTQILLLKGRGCTARRGDRQAARSWAFCVPVSASANERGSIVEKHRSGRPEKAIDSALHHAKLDLKPARAHQERGGNPRQSPASAFRSCTMRALELLR